MLCFARWSRPRSGRCSATHSPAICLPRPLAVGAAPVIGWAVFSAATLPISDADRFHRPDGHCRRGALRSARSCRLASWSRRQRRCRRAAPAIPIVGLCAPRRFSRLCRRPRILPKIPRTACSSPIRFSIMPRSRSSTRWRGKACRRSILSSARSARPGGLPIIISGISAPRNWRCRCIVSGWEADIGLTWFTAFASLTLMMGIAVWLSKDARAAILVVLLAAAASLRVHAQLDLRLHELTPFLEQPTGFAGWLFQAAWAPQHLMSASCVVAAMLLLVRYAQRPEPRRAGRRWL